MCLAQKKALQRLHKLSIFEFIGPLAMVTSLSGPSAPELMGWVLLRGNRGGDDVLTLLF